MNESDYDSDEWAKDDIPDLPEPKLSSVAGDGVLSIQQIQTTVPNDDDDDWEQKLPAESILSDNIITKNDDVLTEGEPMIIVNMTILSQLLSLSEIHCKFDPNSVNDPIAVKSLRQRIEGDYSAYSKNNEYLSNRIVIPCGSSVWRPALVQLRLERPRHYFCPIFPLK
jgi:hypothetical protein